MEAKRRGRKPAQINKELEDFLNDEQKLWEIEVLYRSSDDDAMDKIFLKYNNALCSEAKKEIDAYFKAKNESGCNPIILWKTDKLYNAQMKSRRKSRGLVLLPKCWVKYLPFNDYVYILDKEIKDRASLCDMTEQAYIDLIKSFGYELKEDNEFEAKIQRLYRFSSEGEAANFIYRERIKDGLIEPDKKHIAKKKGQIQTIKSNVSTLINRRLVNGKPINTIYGYIIKKL